MRDFRCPDCGQHLAFENSVCLACRNPVGFSLDEMAFRVINPDEDQLCANLHLAQCNWLVRVEPVRALCASCRLTRTRPADHDAPALAAYAEAEQAKRRLIVELHELNLPVIGRYADPEHGLAFDLLSSAAEKVVTGHHHGVITLDLAEGDDLHREHLRIQMDEPYRTVLGHFRHEVGHYYFYRLVDGFDSRRDRFTALFGDPDTDYQAALDRHYRDGPPAGWDQEYVSSYASMHSSEDWAETFAHYLHIRGTLDTAAGYGLAPGDAVYQRRMPGGFDAIIEMWLPLAWSLNMLNRTMGKPDLYPFVLPGTVLEKMRFIHEVADETAL